MFLLELTTGLRPGELIALKWSDLDAESGILTVAEERSLENGKVNEYGSRTRQVQLMPDVVAQLKLEHEKHPNHPMMFVHPGTNKPYSINMARLLHKHITKTAGIPHVRFVDLRHTCAVHALQNGLDVRELARMLGNTRLVVVRRSYENDVSTEKPISTTNTESELNSMAGLDAFLGI